MDTETINAAIISAAQVVLTMGDDDKVDEVFEQLGRAFNALHGLAFDDSSRGAMSTSLDALYRIARRDPSVA